MIGVLLKSKEKEAFAELPVSDGKLQEMLGSLGVPDEPENIWLTHDFEDGVQVKVFAQTELDSMIVSRIKYDDTLLHLNRAAAFIAGTELELNQKRKIIEDSKSDTLQQLCHDISESVRNQALIIHADLRRKAPEFVPSACIVEEFLGVAPDEFENLVRNPLEDNPLIEQNLSLMYFDGCCNHCLLIYDEEGGDGLLIESSGYAYARYAQYVPHAKTIVEHYKQQCMEHRFWDVPQKVRPEEENSDDEESPGLKNIFG